MHFKIDKVVFFGYHETVEKHKKHTEEFLKQYCGVKTVVFHSLSSHDLQSVLNTLRKQVEYEKGQKNRVYVDITGGESLILAAMGMLSKECRIPMHMVDIYADRVIELDYCGQAGISQELEARRIPMTLDLMIRMQGGVINGDLQKRIKKDEEAEFTEDTERIYEVANRYWTYWNPFSAFLRSVMMPTEGLCVSRRTQTVMNGLLESNTKLRTLTKFNEIIDRLADAGILLNVSRSDGHYKLEYKNEELMTCLMDGGTILELHTCKVEKERNDEALAGVHLDWDGIIHEQRGVDVLNEIDVLSLSGNILTFISCKSGNMGSQQTLHALYELETVAGRFGGKYSRKVLVTVKDIGEVYAERAEEMGIEVRCESRAPEEY